MKSAGLSYALIVSQPRKLHDRYFKQAKAEGYLARSAYKLLEIQERHGVMRRGDRVLDLGCAPGSWMQVAEKLVGPRGLVVGVDLSPVTHRFPPHVHHFVGDVFLIDAGQLLGVEQNAVGRSNPLEGVPRFDVVLSDMAPSTTGHGDDFLSVRLCRRILELVPDVLRPGGVLVMKVLEGEEFPQLLNETRVVFASIKGFKPKASRDVSREMFIIASGWKGRHRTPDDAQRTQNRIAKSPPVPWSTPRAEQ